MDRQAAVQTLRRIGSRGAEQLSRIIDTIRAQVRAAVWAAEPEAAAADMPDLDDLLVSGTYHPPMDHQEDPLPEEYPVDIRDVARLDPRACADHLTKLRLYPNAETTTEYHRRGILQAKLRSRLPQDDLPGQPARSRVVGRIQSRASRLSRLLSAGHGNGIAWVGFVLGVAAIPFWFVIVVPLAAIICSGVALARARTRLGKGRVPARVGLGSGLVFFLFHLVVRLAVVIKG